MKKLILWTESFARYKYKEFYLFWISFTESSFFLVPPDVLIIAILSHGLKVSWFRIASIATIGSVSGGILGYIIGFYLYSYIGAPLVSFYGLEDKMNHVGDLFNQHAFISILVAAFTPIPYKVFTIGAGLFSINFFTFILASILGRGARFFLVSYFVNKYGYKAKKFLLEKADKFLLLIGIIILVSLYFFTR